MKRIPSFLHLVAFTLLMFLAVFATGCSKPPSDLIGTYVHAESDGTNTLLKLNTDFTCETIMEAGKSRTKIWDGKWKFDGSIIKVEAPRFGVSVEYERVGSNIKRLTGQSIGEEFIKR